MLKLFLLLILCFVFTACGGGSSNTSHSTPSTGSSSGGTGSSSGSTPPSNASISLSFTRITSSHPNPFIVKAIITENTVGQPGLANELIISTSKGTVGEIRETSSGTYEFTVTPEETGEHEVRVSLAETSVAQTALVLDYVHDDWGQPMKVSGLVNTAGYEDGVTVTPDGQYLFVQYGPAYFTGLILFNLPRSDGGCDGNRLEFPIGTPNRCSHIWIDNIIGPISSPERPEFFAGRIHDGRWLHNANSWNIATEAFNLFAPSTLIYGFKKQDNGSFAEPFYLAFNDENDGLISPFGLSFFKDSSGKTTLAFAFNDPSDPDHVDLDGDGMDDTESFIDVYATEIELGQNTILGEFIPSTTPGNPPTRSSYFPSKLVNFGKTGLDGITGTQGNPHLYSVEDNIVSIWTDDEYDTGGDHGDLSLYFLNSGNLENGEWSKLTLPSKINQSSPSNEIQPFFTGSELFFTRSTNTSNPEIFISEYSGQHSLSSLANNDNWSVAEKLLSAGSSTKIGNATAVGEPTIANTSDGRYLYFVYGYIRGYDNQTGLPDIDLQAGYIKKKQ